LLKPAFNARLVPVHRFSQFRNFVPGRALAALNKLVDMAEIGPVAVTHFLRSDNNLRLLQMDLVEPEHGDLLGPENIIQRQLSGIISTNASADIYPHHYLTISVSSD
jgi:hypothetical protein